MTRAMVAPMPGMMPGGPPAAKDPAQLLKAELENLHALVYKNEVAQCHSAWYKNSAMAASSTSQSVLLISILHVVILCYIDSVTLQMSMDSSPTATKLSGVKKRR